MNGDLRLYLDAIATAVDCSAQMTGEAFEYVLKRWLINFVQLSKSANKLARYTARFIVAHMLFVDDSMSPTEPLRQKD